MESLCSDHSGNSVSGMSGMSLSAMSGVSIVSTHSLKSGKSIASNRPTEPSSNRAKDGPRAKLRAKSHFGATSTPVSQDSTKPFYHTLNPYYSARISPVTSNVSPVTPNAAEVKSDVSAPMNAGQVQRSTPPQQGIVGEDEYSIETALAMGPDVTTLLNRLNSQFGDFDTPTPTNSESTLSLKDHYSSQEYLMRAEESPLQMAVGNVNLAFEDDANDFDHASMRSFGPVRITNKKSSPARSDSPGDVFHPGTYAGTGVSPRQSPVKLEPGVTNPGFSRGSSPGYSRGSSSSPGNSRGSSPHIRDPRRLNRMSPALSRDSSLSRGESPHEIIAMKILQDTANHMNAVENMQRKAKLEQAQQRAAAQNQNSPLRSNPAHSAFASNFPKPGENPDKTYGAWKVVSGPRRSSGSSTTSIGDSAATGSPPGASSKLGGSDSGVESSAEQIDKKTVNTSAGQIDRTDATLNEGYNMAMKAPPPIKAKPILGGHDTKLNSRTSGINQYPSSSSLMRTDAETDIGNSNFSHPTPTSSNSTLNSNMSSPHHDIPSIVRPQAPRSNSTASSTATLPMRKKINYNPPLDYTNTSVDSTDSSMNANSGNIPRPDSTQSSMYSSTSSIPSVIHVPTSKPNAASGSMTLPHGKTLIDRRNGTFPSKLRLNPDFSEQLETSIQSAMNMKRSEVIDTNDSANSNLPNASPHRHQNGDIQSGSYQVLSPNPVSAAATNGSAVYDLSTKPSSANSNYGTYVNRTAAPKPFANGVGWSSVNGPKSPKSPNMPTSPKSPNMPTSPRTPTSPSRTVAVRRVYQSEPC